MEDIALSFNNYTAQSIYALVEADQLGYEQTVEWDAKAKSLFIESLLCSLPVPVIVSVKSRRSRKTFILDGNARTQVIHEFFKDGFSLTGLELRSDLNGLSFSELNREDTDAIQNVPIPVSRITLDDTSDLSVLNVIYKRLNPNRPIKDAFLEEI